MFYKLKYLAKHVSSFNKIKRVGRSAINDPKKIYKYLNRVGSKRWIDNFFNSYKEFDLYRNEIKDSQLLESLDNSLKEKFKNISGETVRGNPFIPGIIKKSQVFDLYSILRKVNPDVVVETGVCNGYSTAIILEALNRNDNGKLYSIDYPEFADNRHNVNDFWSGKLGAVIPVDENSGWLVPPNLRSRWNLIVGKSQNELVPLLDELKKIDIFLHDSEHSYENQIFEFITAFRYLKSGGLLIASDINWNNSFDDFDREAKNMGNSFYLDYDLAVFQKTRSSIGM